MKTPQFEPTLTNLPLLHQGKTRDTFPAHKTEEEFPNPTRLLVVATDRISTHDIIHKSTIPRKGEVLTALTIFWLTDVLSRPGLRHHLIAWGRRIYDYLPGTRGDYPADLHHRAIVVKKLEMIPVEFIFRSYLIGSLDRKYYSKGLPNPYGIKLPDGLPVMYPFNPAIFTPTEKSETDDELNSEETRRKYETAHDLALEVYLRGQEYLRSRGLELLDSKFEVGVDSQGNVVLADEVLTPDSSRYCYLEDVQVGQEPPWRDKQLARDEAERIWNGGKKYPLTFSPEIVEKLSETYQEVLVEVTGMSLERFQKYLDA